MQTTADIAAFSTDAATPDVEQVSLPRLLSGTSGASARLCRKRDSKSNDRVSARQSSFASSGLISVAGCRVSDDNVEGKLPDPAAKVASRCARMVIFFAFCQGVQAFMSYDGGATPASLDTIQEEMANAWTPAEFGILGSIDKIGMTATSIIWGRCLQLCGAKPLLLVGLMMNALCTFAFGSLRNKWLMYAAKFFMGSTQSLQGVWSTVWTVTMAPPERKSMWLGLGAVSAGIGNGLGTAAAGFGTANGLPYAFAFQVQAAMLMLLWAGLCFVPRRQLRTELPKADEEPVPRTESEKRASSVCEDAAAVAMPLEDSKQSGKPVPVGRQMNNLWRNEVFCLTALQISLVMFEVAGIQFIWVRVFVKLWGLSKNFTTVMYLIVAGLGGGIGVAFGPAYIDNKGGYGTMPGVVRSLGVLQKLAFGAALSGAIGIACLYGKLKTEASSGEFGDAWLWFTWLLLGAIHALHNGSVAALCGINIEVVASEERTFASGVELTVRNILGYACGPLLPGLVMQLIDNWEGWSQKEDPNNERWQLYGGLAFVLAMNLVGVLILRKCKKAASRELLARQSKALDALRDAFRAQDIAALEQAVVQARSVDLHKTDGEAVLGMANQLIGAHRGKKADTEEAFHHSVVFSSTQMQLQHRVIELEREVSGLRRALGEREQRRDFLGPAVSGAKEALLEEERVYAGHESEESPKKVTI